MSTILSGASFGAALVAAGMYQPSVILGQLKFENFQMLQTFLAAAASSTSVFPCPYSLRDGLTLFQALCHGPRFVRIPEI